MRVDPWELLKRAKKFICPALPYLAVIIIRFILFKYVKAYAVGIRNELGGTLWKRICLCIFMRVFPITRLFYRYQSHDVVVCLPDFLHSCVNEWPFWIILLKKMSCFHVSSLYFSDDDIFSWGNMQGSLDYNKIYTGWLLNMRKNSRSYLLGYFKNAVLFRRYREIKVFRQKQSLQPNITCKVPIYKNCWQSAWIESPAKPRLFLITVELG